MSDETPNTPPCGSYTVNMSRGDLVDIYVRRWVLKWCRKYYPEAFKKAEEQIRGLMEDKTLDIDKEL
jgi:hypothetical protein